MSDWDGDAFAPEGGEERREARARIRRIYGDRRRAERPQLRRRHRAALRGMLRGSVLRHQLLAREVALVGLLAVSIVLLMEPARLLLSGEIQRAGASLASNSVFLLVYGWWVIALFYLLAQLMTALLRRTGLLVLHLLGAGAVLAVPVMVLHMSHLGGLALQPGMLLTVWALPMLARAAVIPWTARPRPRRFAVDAVGVVVGRWSEDGLSTSAHDATFTHTGGTPSGRSAPES